MSTPDEVKPYKLIPNNYLQVKNRYEEDHYFRVLHELSMKNFDGKVDAYEHKNVQFFNVLDQEDIAFIEQENAKNETLSLNEGMFNILKKIFNPKVDNAIKNYLKSNYAILFFDYREIHPDSSDNDPSLKWHCDQISERQMVLMTYLNGESEHGSSTLWMDEPVTQKLKELGYVYSEVDRRMQDLSPLLEDFDLPNEVHRHSFSAGEMIALCPTQVIHRAEKARDNCVRKTFDICIMPSPVPWYEAIERGYQPATHCLLSDGQAKRLIEKVLSVPIESLGETVIMMTQTGRITSLESFKFHLETMFSNKHLANELYEKLSNSGLNILTITASELILHLKHLFFTTLDSKIHFTLEALQNVQDLIQYETEYTESILAYSSAGKIKPEAIMWPVPNHPKYPRCKYDMLPFVRQHKIMDKTTPIGSAGSCFAVEIAKVLQEENFNYVVTELGDNPYEEAIIDGYKVGSGKAMYSANFGILFNTPSLKQLAEKAFGTRRFTKYLVELDNGLYMDPYRENVYFQNRDCYLRDYPKHIAAVRRVLLESEVFVFTVGLNECWGMRDGTVISRNPRNGFHHLIQHRVLTVEENVENIVRFYKLVKKHNPKFKLVLTLSPVPLIATGRADKHHIIEANTHSKAVLRVAIEQAVSQLEDAYYLPSYELVTECIKDPWDEDHRHVTRETVEQVIHMFNEIFVRQS